MVQRDRRRFGQEAVEYDSTQDALKGASKMVGQMGQQALHKEKALADADAANRINAADREAMTFTEDHKIKWSKDPRNKEAHSEYTSGLREIYERNREGIDPVGLSTYNGFSTGRQQKGNLSSTSWEIDQNEKNIYTAVESNVETNLDRSYEYGRSGDLQGALQAYRDSNETLAVTGQNLDPQQQSKLLKGYESDSMAKFLDGTIESNPYQTMEYLKNEQVTTSLGSGEAVDEVRSKAEKKIKAMDGVEKALKEKGGVYTKEKLNELSNANMRLASEFTTFDFTEKNGIVKAKNGDVDTIDDIMAFRSNVNTLHKEGGMSDAEFKKYQHKSGLAVMQKVRGSNMKRSLFGKAFGYADGNERTVSFIDSEAPDAPDFEKSQIYERVYNRVKQRNEGSPDKISMEDTNTKSVNEVDTIVEEEVRSYYSSRYPKIRNKDTSALLGANKLDLYNSKANNSEGISFSNTGYKEEYLDGKWFDVLRDKAGNVIDQSEAL